MSSEGGHQRVKAAIKEEDSERERERGREMEGVVHQSVFVNGINMHYAEKGTGPAILFLHGFPELWYSWRHQIAGLSARGYRCIAPDMRGFGDTDAPPLHTSYTVYHIVGDLIALLDTLGLEQVFVVGHDWGAFIAWELCLLRPDRVTALVNTSVIFNPFKSELKPIQLFRALYGDDFYISTFQNPGEAEAEFKSVSTATVMRFFLSYRSPDALMLPKGTLQRFAEGPQSIPSWLSEEDINYYATKFEKTGFTGGFNYYRAIDLNWELTSAVWKGAQVKVPTKFIVGDLDLTYSGVKEYIHGGEFKKDVPFLQEVVVMEGVAHWLNQEKGEELSDHIYEFIHKFF